MIANTESSPASEAKFHRTTSEPFQQWTKLENTGVEIKIMSRTKCQSFQNSIHFRPCNWPGIQQKGERAPSHTLVSTGQHYSQVHQNQQTWPCYLGKQYRLNKDKTPEYSLFNGSHFVKNSCRSKFHGSTLLQSQQLRELLCHGYFCNVTRPRRVHRQASWRRDWFSLLFPTLERQIF